MRIINIVGARPNFMKVAPLHRAMAADPGFEPVLVHTGQHYDEMLSAVFFKELELPPPDIFLGVGSDTHARQTAAVMQAVEPVFLARRPDLVLVVGDVNSTLACALVASKLHIPVAHVEAGLRSFNRRMPEEINRVLTDHAADMLFAPTETAMRNLAAEGIAPGRCHLVGDVMYDASLFYRERARMPEWFPGLGIEPGEFVLATVHRAENTDDPARLSGIMQGLAGCGLPVILPLHPRTRGRLRDCAIAPGPNVRITDPVGYLEMVWLEANCRVVATDSGGVQKEAYFFAKPCVTLRDETEWVELVESGWNVLAGASSRTISECMQMRSVGLTGSLYGKGDAAKTIVHLLQAQ